MQRSPEINLQEVVDRAGGGVHDDLVIGGCEWVLGKCVIGLLSICEKEFVLS